MIILFYVIKTKNKLLPIDFLIINNTVLNIIFHYTHNTNFTTIIIIIKADTVTQIQNVIKYLKRILSLDYLRIII